MTNERARSELNQIYGMLSEEKKKALDVAFKAMEQKPCEDAISRKEVLNKIFYSTDNSGDVVLGSVLRHRIENLPPVKPQEPKIVPIANIHFDEDKMREICKEVAENIEVKQDWIPVSERLPKPNEYVGNVCRYCLIQNEYRDMMVARWDGQGWEQMYQYGEYIEDEVIAWMPLPKRYDPQESEE